MRFCKARTLVAALGTGLASGPAWAQAPANPAIVIEPMTQVDRAAHTGYFSDPFPIHTVPLWYSTSIPQSFSGTAQAILSCPGPIQPECFTPTPIAIDPALIRDQAKAAGAALDEFQNDNITQEPSGQWDMATTLRVHDAAHPAQGHWNVIVHAHPLQYSASIPTEWVADTVLVGALAQPGKANYDGKYFNDDGTLYLLYSKRLSDTPAHDGVVAQLMDSPTQPAAADPTVLIAPSYVDGGFNSEYFFGLDQKNPFKLVETGNITRIEGKYALAYSTGAFNESDYKTGVAWSDTFLPAPGTTYKKVLKPDPTGIWGQPGHLEVLYLLQSQEPAWPNDVASQVLAPGVPSFVKDGHGQWLLFFAGYAPNDHPADPTTGDFIPNNRRPFFTGLSIDIPPGATVAATSSEDLATWLTVTVPR